MDELLVHFQMEQQDGDQEVVVIHERVLFQ
jgi:hypothetical protein